MVKTNAMRLLETAGIPYEAIEYEVDESDLSGVHVAELVQLPPEQLFKTLVLRGDKHGYLVCCIPVNEELDLKKAARVCRDKKIEMLPVKDLLKTTGYIRGGCSPVGMKKKFPTYIDETAILSERIGISGGARGVQLMVEPEQLREYVAGTFCDLVKVV